VIGLASLGASVVHPWFRNVIQGNISHCISFFDVFVLCSTQAVVVKRNLSIISAGLTHPHVFVATPIRAYSCCSALLLTTRSCGLTKTCRCLDCLHSVNTLPAVRMRCNRMENHYVFVSPVPRFWLKTSLLLILSCKPGPLIPILVL